jgi:hypothetical protein
VVTIKTRILQDFQRALRNFEASICDFQSALNSSTETSDQQLMVLKHSKMGVDGLIVDAVMHSMLHQN